MYNLRLADSENNNAYPTEYYMDDDPVKFLGSLNILNIVVGANNSRKSRFIRHIIQLQNRTVIETKTNLNIIFYIGVGIKEYIDELKNNGFSKAIIEVSMIHRDRAEMIILKEYFERVNRNELVLDLESIDKLVSSILDGIQGIREKRSQPDVASLLKQLVTIAQLIKYLYGHFDASGGKYVHSASYPNSPYKALNPSIPNLGLQQLVPYISEILKLVDLTISWCQSLSDIKFLQQNGKNIYIPALRTSKKLIGISTDVFEQTLRHHHFRDIKSEILEIHTGLKLYEKINLARNGNKADRDAFSEFEKFIGLSFFKTDDIHIVPYTARHEDEDGIKITIAGHKSDVPIQDLGEGVQGIINLLFPIFTATAGDWIFVDEPENHLHPGFQNIFTKAISETQFILDKNLRFFINTHSNHILAESFLSGPNTSIFIFSQRDETSSNIKIFEQDHYNILELLGVMNTSVFTTNCTVWVGGVTDRFYLRAFLKAYLDTLPANSYRPSEGFDYSFVEYAGKNLTHYDFDFEKNENIGAYFINSNVFVLADTDFDPEKHKRYKKIKRKNFTYAETGEPEIENLLTESVLKQFLVEELKCDKHSVQAINFTERKMKLGKVFSGVTRKGKVLRFEAEYGGTLSAYYKSKLSMYVFEKMISGEIGWSTISTSHHLTKIIKSLYRFIKSSNRR